jgi:hypothetical protein
MATTTAMVVSKRSEGTLAVRIVDGLTVRVAGWQQRLPRHGQGTRGDGPVPSAPTLFPAV